MRSDALDVQTGSKKGVVEARNEAAHLGVVVNRLCARLVVHVHCQLVEVLRVIPVRGPAVLCVVEGCCVL